MGWRDQINFPISHQLSQAQRKRNISSSLKFERKDSNGRETRDGWHHLVTRQIENCYNKGMDRRKWDQNITESRVADSNLKLLRKSGVLFAFKIIFLFNIAGLLRLAIILNFFC